MEHYLTLLSANPTKWSNIYVRVRFYLRLYRGYFLGNSWNFPEKLIRRTSVSSCFCRRDLRLSSSTRSLSFFVDEIFGLIPDTCFSLHNQSHPHVFLISGAVLCCRSYIRIRTHASTLYMLQRSKGRLKLSSSITLLPLLLVLSEQFYCLYFDASFDL